MARITSNFVHSSLALFVLINILHVVSAVAQTCWQDDPECPKGYFCDSGSYRCLKCSPCSASDFRDENNVYKCTQDELCPNYCRPSSTERGDVDSCLQRGLPISTSAPTTPPPEQALNITVGIQRKGEVQELRCLVSFRHFATSPDVEWRIANEVITNSTKFTVQKETAVNNITVRLTARNLDSMDKGNYTCSATSDALNQSKSIYLAPILPSTSVSTSEDPPMPNPIGTDEPVVITASPGGEVDVKVVLLSVILPTVVILAMVCAFLFYFKCRRNRAVHGNQSTEAEPLRTGDIELDVNAASSSSSTSQSTPDSGTAHEEVAGTSTTRSNTAETLLFDDVNLPECSTTLDDVYTDPKLNILIQCERDVYHVLGGILGMDTETINVVICDSHNRGRTFIWDTLMPHAASNECNFTIHQLVTRILQRCKNPSENFKRFMSVLCKSHECQRCAYLEAHSCLTPE